MSAGWSVTRGDVATTDRQAGKEVGGRLYFPCSTVTVVVVNTHSAHRLKGLMSRSTSRIVVEVNSGVCSRQHTARCADGAGGDHVDMGIAGPVGNVHWTRCTSHCWGYKRV